MKRPVGKAIGVCHSSGITAYFATSPNRYFGFYEQQGAENDTPAAIDDKIRQMLALNEKKPSLLVLAGDLEFCRSYNDVQLVDYVVYCSDEATLRNLGVPIVDKGWHHGDPQLDFEQFLDGDLWPEIDITGTPVNEARRPLRSHPRWGAALAAAGAVMTATTTHHDATVLVYSAGSNNKPIGRVEPSGEVYDDVVFGIKRGFVDKHGTVTSAALAAVGQIDKGGTIYDTVGEGEVGVADDDGQVFTSSDRLRPVGHVEPPSRLAAGAAYLLLMR